MSPDEVREIVRAVEEGWRQTLGAVREGEAHRTDALRKRVRSLTISLIVLVITAIAACTAGLAVLSAQTNRLDGVVAAQAASRKATLVDRCRQSNDLATGLRQFVRQVAPKLLPLAERKFRVQPDCERYAERLLKTP